MADEKKMVRVKYDAYEKQFHFEFSSDGKSYNSIAGQSRLAKFTGGKYELRNCAQEIISIIHEDYNRDSMGIDIDFWGTEDDYAFFKATLMGAGLKLNLLEHIHTLISADAALSHIVAAYEKIKGEFPDGQDASAHMSKITPLIQKYHETGKSNLNVVVIGVYSSGKSTFINALIGHELLPSRSNPETSSICKIVNAQVKKLEFTLLHDPDETGLPTTICWENGDYQLDHPQLEPDRQETAMLNAIAEAMKVGTSDIGQMRQVIALINEQSRIAPGESGAGGVSFAPLVTISLPFVLGEAIDEDLAVNIYDTPGSNAATKPRHQAALKGALEQQTNALPLFILGRNDLASNDNAALNACVDNYKACVDMANALYVINKADELSLDVLSKGPEIIPEMENKNILYVSSVISLGAKRGGVLEDGDYAEKYDRNKSSFSPGDKHYKQLYRYASLRGAQKVELEELAGKAGSDAQRLQHDCGMYGVEYEIQQYARLFMNYLKAKQRREYLLEALNEAEGQLDGLHSRKRSEEAVHKGKRAEKKQELEVKIQEVCEESCRKERTDAILSEIRGEYWRVLDEFLSSIPDEARRKWGPIKRKKIKGEKRQQTFHEQMIDDCNGFLQEYFPAIIELATEKYNALTRRYEQELSEIIECDSDLSEGAIETILGSIPKSTPNYPVQCTPHFNSDRAFSNFLFWHWINPKKYSEELSRSFETFFMESCIQDPLGIFDKKLIGWLAETAKAFSAALEQDSLILRRYDEKIAELTAEIEAMQTSLDNLAEVKPGLEGLLQYV